MKIKENIKLAVTFTIIPLIPAYLLYKHSFINLAMILIVLSFVIAFCCFVSNNFALKLEKVISKSGNFIGKYISITALFMIYIIALLPTATIMKIVKRDRLKIKKMRADTYWIDNKNKTTSYEYQF